ncbi:unnamed protein product [Rotaria sp. Silwood1]|nr:unnamed protein product [Rotaria sp. Silwood1]CAF1373169.1 unnamed protein product [Rotaria sp. Silwood1]CAF3561408.1 unnamed protein product [Rotaria sp. Silwood1]CAF4879459.1 unnamed protein product [Rotaria sp. Silwood1]
MFQTKLRVDKEWPGGFEAGLEIRIDNQIIDGWEIELRFDQAVLLDVWLGDLRSKTDDRIFVYRNKDWNAQLSAGSVFDFKFVAHNGVAPHNLVCAFFNGKSILTSSSEVANASQTTTSSQSTLASSTSTSLIVLNGKYNYGEVLRMSLLFYESQRAGKLPANNRISWRGDSMLMDKGQNGEDLTGGYFDGGDYVKFGFPMASFTTLLAWGALDYEDAYQHSGQLHHVREAIRWSTDYFIKAHVSEYEFYGQVGDGYDDHASWSRPEDWTKPRPAWKVTRQQPGSDLLAETAAALAAASLVFRSSDPSYASTLLIHARQLYDFANQYRGKYSDSIPNAANFYNSWSGYGDELGWSAAWLLHATGEQGYQTDVEKHYAEFELDRQPQEFSWDDKTAGVQLLMAKITQKLTYRQQVENFCNYIVRQAPKTPKGLVYLDQWGTLRHAANVAFLCLQAADIGINTQDSCPNRPAICDWSAFNNPGPNPQLLIGALIGGPDRNDNYEDRRDDYVKNEVATDYNAGFQSAVAGLLHYQLKG